MSKTPDNFFRNRSSGELGDLFEGVTTADLKQDLQAQEKKLLCLQAFPEIKPQPVTDGQSPKEPISASEQRRRVIAIIELEQDELARREAKLALHRPHATQCPGTETAPQPATATPTHNQVPTAFEPAADKVAPEPEAVIDAMQPPGPVQEQVVAKSQSQAKPSAPTPLELVDAYKAEVREKTGAELDDADIWRKSRYKTRSAFERWVRQDPKRPNKTADQVFRRLLTETKPHLK